MGSLRGAGYFGAIELWVQTSKVSQDVRDGQGVTRPLHRVRLVPRLVADGHDDHWRPGGHECARLEENVEWLNGNGFCTIDRILHRQPIRPRHDHQPASSSDRPAHAETQQTPMLLDRLAPGICSRRCERSPDIRRCR